MARLTGKSRPRLRNAQATSAGGIVVRVGQGRHELVLGLRRLDRDRELWTLPKGTPEPGETIEQTAIREVGEETGLGVRIVEPVGAIDYFFIQDGERIHKTVHYFLMEPEGGDMATHDHEFDEVAWIAARRGQRPDAPRDRAPDRGPRASRHRAHAAPHDGGRLMRRTSLYDRHAAAGARLIEFGGWEMPVQYAGILEEHRAVRQAAGLFDLSHMGELYVRGAGGCGGAGLCARVRPAAGWRSGAPTTP